MWWWFPGVRHLHRQGGLALGSHRADGAARCTPTEWVAMGTVATVWLTLALWVAAGHERSMNALDDTILTYASHPTWNTWHADSMATALRALSASWSWGDHARLHLVPMGFVAAHLPGAWALVRLQVCCLSIGIVGAARLGRAEAGRVGLAAGLLLYAGSPTVAFLALTDYFDLVLAVPAIPWVVLAARHLGTGTLVFWCVVACSEAGQEWPRRSHRAP